MQVDFSLDSLSLSTQKSHKDVHHLNIFKVILGYFI